MKKESKVKLIKLVRITSGKRHAWYETDLGILVRKSIQSDVK